MAPPRRGHAVCSVGYGSPVEVYDIRRVAVSRVAIPCISVRHDRRAIPVYWGGRVRRTAHDDRALAHDRWRRDVSGTWGHDCRVRLDIRIHIDGLRGRGGCAEAKHADDRQANYGELAHSSRHSATPLLLVADLKTNPLAGAVVPIPARALEHRAKN